MKPKKLIFTFSLVTLFLTLTQSLPLSTNSRWIVDANSGDRVKLKCVNWPGHIDTMLVEGLDKRPLQDIAALVASLGFNCVRLTWAIYMYAHHENANLTAATSLDSLGLSNAKKGFEIFNPSLLNSTVVQVQEKVVDELGKNGVMVILDNHVSKPKWCCENDDGNGFFGDKFFDPDLWLQGLKLVANHYKGKTQVVAMSLRNELRGDRQNHNDWYKYITMGIETIHKENPDLLVLVSGLDYDTNLSFLKNKTLESNYDNKLVYEVHRYSWSGARNTWTTKPINGVCRDNMDTLTNNAGFLIEGKDPVPLIMSEYGVDQRGVNVNDNRFLACIMAYIAERDLDWALWALAGSYYMRNELIGPEDTYGVLDANWVLTRNPKFHERYLFVQTMLQDPNSKAATYKILFHPDSGNCVTKLGKFHLQTGHCKTCDKWSYEGDGKPITLIGTSQCLKASGHSSPVMISKDCSNQMSQWTLVSSSKLQIAVKDENGDHLCLQAKSSGSSLLITMKCTCFEDEDKCMDNPQNQWFQLITSNNN